jgi:hypothetical protein
MVEPDPKNGTKRNVNKKKDSNVIAWTLVMQDVACTYCCTKSCQIDIKKGESTLRCNTFKHMWKSIIAQRFKTNKSMWSQPLLNNNYYLFIS